MTITQVEELAKENQIQPTGSAYVKGELLIGSTRLIKGVKYFIDNKYNVYEKWVNFRRHEISDSKRMNYARELAQ